MYFEIIVAKVHFSEPLHNKNHSSARTALTTEYRKIKLPTTSLARGWSCVVQGSSDIDIENIL